MKIQVITEKENPLLKRKEILVSIDYEGTATPSKADIQKLLAEQLKANIENLEISKVLSEIGKSRGKAWIKIWEEKKIPLYSEKKKAPKKEAKPKEKPEEKPKVEKEEKPKEQKSEPKKEEVKEEQKQEEKKEVKETKPEEQKSDQ